MKNKEANRKVLMAISIGLSAALSLMPTVSAFADDDVEPESSGNDTSEESSSKEESSSSSQSVSEASYEVSEAAQEMAQSDAPSAKEVSETFTDISETLSDIASETASVDEAFAVAVTEDNYFEELQEAAEYNTSFAETMVSEATSAVDLASDKAESVLSEAQSSKDAAVAASSVSYSSEAAAESAKTEVAAAVDTVREELTETQAAVDTAQDKLVIAEKSLKAAEEQVETTREAKDKADAARAEAEEKLKSLLDENGISYEVTDDGAIEVDKNAEFSDGKIKSAIDKAQSAVDKAADDAAKAAADHARAEAEDYAAAVTALETAKTALETAKTHLSECEEKAAIESSKAEKLDELLALIESQQIKARETNISGGGSVLGSTEDEYRKLGAYIIAYDIAQRENVVASTVKVARDSSNFHWYVSYKTTDNPDFVNRAYTTVKGKNDNGGSLGQWLNDSANSRNNVAYIEASEQIRPLKPYSFYKDNDTYEGDRKEEYALKESIYKVNKAEPLQVPDDANEGMRQAAEIINAKLSDPATSMTNWSHKAYLSSYYGMYYLYSNGYENVTLGTQAGNIDKVGNTDKSYRQEKWYYYVSLSGTKDGQTYQFYFSYDDAKYADRTEIFLMTPSEMGAASKDNGNSMTVSERDFNEATDDYRTNKAALEAAQAAYYEAESNLDAANDKVNEQKDILDELAGKRDATKSLKDKVEAAKTAVEKAAEELQNARHDLSVTQSELDALTEKLAEARDEYNKAVDELDAAKEKVGEIEDIINAINEALGGGFTYASPVEENTDETQVDITDATSDDAEVSDASDSSSSDSDSTGDEASATPASGVSAATVYTDAEPVMSEASDAGVLGERDEEKDQTGSVIQTVNRAGASEEARAAMASAVLDAGVLPDGGVPEGEILDDDVLGQRMAPIVEALENGTFSRGMMFTEDGLKVSFMWWLIIVVLGAKGVQMYIKSRRKEEAEK